MINIQFNERLGFHRRLDFINLYNDSLQDKIGKKFLFIKFETLNLGSPELSDCRGCRSYKEDAVPL
jgi:hypothetical protein